ncbi:MAG: glycosyltransferase [Acidimicrobiales bacterium]|jgi:UDP:flavonoid glycosyltransferase YjiC (YdhE family)
MRVVVSCVPQTGHVVPLLALAQAFDARGDEVVVATGPDVAELVLARNLRFHPVGQPLDAWFAALRARTRGFPGDGLAPSRVESYFVPRLFGEIGMALMVDDLLELCRELEAEILVFDPYVFAAPLVAAVSGAHPVVHCIAALMDEDVLGLAADAVSPIWREFGLDVPSAAGLYSGSTLTICPPSLDPAAGRRHTQALRPAPLPVIEPADLPVSFDNPRRPLVYLTLGTFSNNDLDLFRLVIAALEDEQVNVLATVGRDNDPSVLAPLPDNARAERFVPQADVLPHCSAVIHHAGAGTMFGVLSHGLPSLALPQSADNFNNAALMQRAGAAQVLMPGEVTVPAVASKLRAVLESTDISERTRLIADEIRAMPSPDEMAARLAGQFASSPA